MISVSTKMPYQEVREISLRSGKSQEKSGKMKVEKTCHLEIIIIYILDDVIASQK